MSFAVVRNIQNNQLYKYIGGNTFINIITGKEGEVPDEVAQKIFKINIEATEILNECPEVENLIKALQLIVNTQKTEDEKH